MERARSGDGAFLVRSGQATAIREVLLRYSAVEEGVVAYDLGRKCLQSWRTLLEETECCHAARSADVRTALAANGEGASEGKSFDGDARCGMFDPVWFSRMEASSRSSGPPRLLFRAETSDRLRGRVFLAWLSEVWTKHAEWTS